MKIEERLAHLAEHGVGCPQAVKLGGETAVAAWCEQQELTLEAALAEAETAEAIEAEAEASAEADRIAETEAAEDRARAAVADAEAAGPVEVTTEPEEGPEDAPEDFPPAGSLAEIVEDQKAVARQLGAILDRVDLLEGATDRLTKAVDALAVKPKPKAKGKGKGK